MHHFVLKRHDKGRESSVMHLILFLGSWLVHMVSAISILQATEMKDGYSCSPLTRLGCPSLFHIITAVKNASPVLLISLKVSWFPLITDLIDHKSERI